MFSKILVANRGEIAVRVIRACKEMGIGTVAVFSEADADALHVQLADEAVCIGPPKARDSYLNMQNIISAAYNAKASAIHPGFGFLSENNLFAQMCGECGIKFIGPSPEAMLLLGNKANARKLMHEAGVPTIPGSEGTVRSYDEALSAATETGFPVMVKASAGGGGRGIRIARNAAELRKAYDVTKSEAKAAFGDDGIYVEKLIENARHIEIQLLCDERGSAVSLGERDCSLQRRSQKVLEEAPSIAVSQKLRDELGAAAVSGARAAGYTNAGTMEFLFDNDTGRFYFMEMNARIQVEHPVTEMVTGIDIVREQINVALGGKLGFGKDDFAVRGHSLECRINAENPANNFSPSPGKIEYLFLPGGGPGLRVDSAVYAGYTIPPYYDSMIAKVITHGKTRADAIGKMKRALSEFVITGIDNNVDFQLEILNNIRYMEGKAINTRFIEDEILGGR